ncbi:MAG TPA: carboxypeptidase regulatory-like domain-containing protein [Pyrinomonadaceae bacterium]|nr:carboxypeptidase regulatory-like domain-containing protein [Pyrinomonadaceae bacterium]
MIFRALLVVVFVFTLSTLTFGQTSRGTVSGTVTDPTGAVISGADVTLTSAATKLNRTTKTNNEGLYRFEAVDPGSYSVKVNATGFGEIVSTGIEVQANQTSDVPAQMAPAGQVETVNVAADAGQLLQVEAPVRGGNIDKVRITELPFSGRNPVSLALTLPGVSTNRFGFGVGTFSVNGSRGRSNNFLIDGTENNDISVAGQAFQITNPDAVQEVSVQTSNYDAEFGRAGGAVVNTITKSGSDDFHGSLAYLFDVTRDDAITNTQSLSAAIRDRGHPPRGTEQYYAGTLGGPLLFPNFGEGKPMWRYDGKQRTFFFAAWQEQFRSASTQASRTVLSQAGRNKLRGIFPTGANPRVDLLMDVTRNVIGESSFQNIDIGARPGCPAPCNIQFGTGSLFVPQTYRERQVQLRIDHKLGENDQFSARYLFDDQKDPLGGGITFPGFGTANNNTYQNLLLSETHIFSPSWTNEARLAYNRILIDFPLNPADELGLVLPRFDISTLSQFGIATNLPQGRVANNYVFQDTVTHLHGNHTFRLGLDLLQQRSRQFAPIVERGLLTYRSGGGFTALGNYIDNFAGSGGGTQRDFGSPRYYPFLFRQAYFVQDRWHVNPSTTLTLGLRYENFGNAINTLHTAAFTGLFNVNPVTFAGPYSEPNDVADDNNNFAPTFGLAWAPSFESGLLRRFFGNRDLVVRMGYQLGYDSFFNNIASNAATSSPNVVATAVPSVVNAGAPRGLTNVTGALPLTARPLSPLDSQTLVVGNLVNPYYQRWSVGVQRALHGNLVIDASYVGSKGTKLYLNEDLNPSVPAVANAFNPGIQRITPAGFTGSTTCTPNTTGCLISGRLDNLQGSRLIRTNGGSSSYHSAQLLVTRRFTNGFSLSSAYTWSKLIDNASEVFTVADTNLPQQASFPAIFGGQAAERAVSFFDRTHRFSLTYVYELPFMRNQEGFVGHLIGGFQISGVTTFETGVPLTVVNGQDADSIGGNLDRPDFNPNGQTGVRAVPAIATATVNPCSVAVGATFYTNPDSGNACINPATAQYIGLLAGSGRRGNLGRNTLRTPGQNNWNVNILKKIHVGEASFFELRAEFYNIFNHPQYGTASISPFSPGSTGVPANVFTSAAGQFLHPEFSDGGGRVIRYQLKFAF